MDSTYPAMPPRAHDDAGRDPPIPQGSIVTIPKGWCKQLMPSPQFGLDSWILLPPTTLTWWWWKPYKLGFGPWWANTPLCVFSGGEAASGLFQLDL